MITKEQRFAVLQVQNMNTEVLPAIVSNVSVANRTSSNGKNQVLQINFAVAIGTVEHGATKALYFTKEQLPMVGQWFGINADSRDESALAELITSKLRSGEISRKCEVVYVGHNAGDQFVNGDAIDTRKETGFSVNSIITGISATFSAEIAKESAKATIAKENTLAAQLRAKKKADVKPLSDEEKERKSVLEAKGKLNATEKEELAALDKRDLVKI